MEEKYISDVEAFLRKSMSEENDAISVYEQRAQLAKTYAEDIRETNEELADKLDDIAYTLEDIKKEEEVHLGELQEIIKLIGVTEENEDKGKEEAEENIEESFLKISKRLASFL